ncbi:MAG TPA: ATP-binding protein [Longimicrobiales bacterium]|nr:ATP-binding protein [Longimicrobiales bacterium]
MKTGEIEPSKNQAAVLLRLLGEVVAATQSASTRDALAAVLSHVCAAMRWPVGHAYVATADGTLESAGIWHLPDAEQFAELRRVSESTRFRAGDGLPGRVLAERRPVWIANLERDTNFPRAGLARELGVRSALAFPVLVRDQVAAVLEFFAEEPTEPDEHLIALMASVGSHLGYVFERFERDAAWRESAERFRALADNAAEAIVTIDVEDRIHYANPATARVFGYEPSELLSMSFAQLMPEEYGDRHRAGMRRYVATGKRKLSWDGVELPGLHRDGHEIPLEVTFGEFMREGKQFFNGIMRDVTERRRAEAERIALLQAERTARAAAEEAHGEAERRARQEQALRQAAAAVASAFTVDETSRRIAESAVQATHADGAFVHWVDIETGELIVIAVAGALAPPLGSRSAYAGSATEQVIEHEEPIVVDRVSESRHSLHPELKAECDDCCAAVIPLLDAAEPIGSLVLLRRPERDRFRPDELERAFTFGELASLAFRKIHLLEDSERKREELERVMESRARLIRGFGHDVKNPLGAADGFLELLQERVLGELSDKQAESLERTRRSLGAAIGLIDDLLELARAEAGQLEIRAAATDVREAARETAEEYRAQAETASLTIRIDVPNEFPIIESDPARVRQIVGNLLSNAVKYTPEGGTVTVAVERREEAPFHAAGGRGTSGWAVASVSDTGRGIPADKLELLFEEFARLDPDVGSGAGIGLAISRRLARALGGDVTVDSEPGRGSTFSLWLPLAGPEEGASV